MILCVSDVHFGRKGSDHDRQMEQELIDCLRHFESEISELVLLGDIFDYYIEYREVIPKGLVRFQALLSEWTASGTPITYLVGNHDPWHQDYFRQDLGVDVKYGPVIRHMAGHTVYLAHGDGLTRSKPVYYGLKPFLRNPFLVGCYRTLLPADLGVRLARWYSRTFADDVPDPAVIDDLRAYARGILHEGPSSLAILGHSHVPEITRWDHGVYTNCGSWLVDRTFVVLDEEHILLYRWNGTQPLLVEQSHTVAENPEA